MKFFQDCLKFGRECLKLGLDCLIYGQDRIIWHLGSDVESFQPGAWQLFPSLVFVIFTS